MTTEDMIRKALERPLVCKVCGKEYDVSVYHFGKSTPMEMGEVEQHTFEWVREPLAQAVLDALSKKCDHPGPVGKKSLAVYRCGLCKTEWRKNVDFPAPVGYVPRTVDLNDRVSVAEACGRLVFIVAQVVLDDIPSMTTAQIGPMVECCMRRDYTVAHDALGRLLDDVWSVEVSD